MISIFRSLRSSCLLLSFLVPMALPGRAAAQDSLPRTLSLGGAARLAAQQSATALTARYRAEQVRSHITQQRAALLPTISASAIRQGNTFNTITFGIPFPGFSPTGSIIGPVNTLDMHGQISQTLFNAAAFERVRSANTSATASSASAASAAQQAAGLAANAYLQAQRAAAELDARLADSVLADSLVLIARKQTQAGVGVALDVTRAEAQLASVRAQLIGARNARDIAMLGLLRSLGLPLDAEITLTDSLATLPLSDTLPSEQDAITAALQRRPDLRATEEQLHATQQTESAIRAEWIPSVSVFGNDGVLGGNTSHLLNTYNWGIELSIPLFQGFGRTGRLQEQQAMERQIETQRQDLHEQVATEVRGALMNMASAHEQVEASRERLRLAQQEVAQASDRFRAGVAGNADVITASLDLNSSRNQLIDALTAYQTARVSLAQAEGAVTALP
ncbi:MAG TPA: TolC family protein [Gemmatimonadaceae bacterium]|nr:TolC family protein [Gemmatimonadaceae bacterium]